VRLFLERGLAEKLLFFIVAAQFARALGEVTFLVTFFRGFHPANRNLRAGGAIPPAIETTVPAIGQNGRLGAELVQLFFPAQSVALLRFRHPEQNAAPLFIRLVPREVAINQGGFPFGAPVGAERCDCLGVFRFNFATLY
jgi:hypothetical protein